MGGHPPEWEASQRGDLNHLYGAVLNLCLPLASYLVLFLTPDQSQGLPQEACTSFSPKLVSRANVYGTYGAKGYQDLLRPGTASLSDPEGSFCPCGVGSP